MSTSGAETSGLTSVSAADTTIIATGSTAIELRANLGTAAGTVAAGNDPRFTEINGVQITGAPVAGQVPIASSATAAAWGTPAGGGSGVTSVAAANSTITVSGTATAPTLAANIGTAAGTVAAGNDSRILAAVPNTTQINGHTLTGDITLAASDVGAATTAQGAEADTALQPATGMMFVNGGSNAATARPADAGAVYWVMSVAPTNKATQDIWLDTSS